MLEYLNSLTNDQWIGLIFGVGSLLIFIGSGIYSFYRIIVDTRNDPLVKMARDINRDLDKILKDARKKGKKDEHS